MKVFITDLIAYNEGHLIGRWIKLPLLHIKLVEVIYEVLSEGEIVSGSSTHEEVFITDYEADITIYEYDDIARLNELAEVLENYTAQDLLKLKLLTHEGYKEREVIEKGIESYEVDFYDYSDNTSFTDVYELLAYDLVDEGLFGSIPNNFINYIDYSAIGRDLSYDYVEFEHGVLGRIS